MLTLVTGATGGLGRVAVATLHEQGHRVRGTGRDGAALAALGVPGVAADLAVDALEPLVAGVETVFHLAALSAPWGAAQDFERANLLATQRLLAAAQHAGCRRFIFTGTPSIYACAADRLNLREDSPLPRRPANAYARTKLAAERAVLAADRPGFRTVVLRPRAILSPHDRVLLPRLLRAAERGRLPLPRGGRALVEPTDARDVTAALLAAALQAETVGGKAFNISGGQPVAVRDLVAGVFARLQRPVRLLSVPAPLVLAAGGLLEALARLHPRQPEPILTRYTAMTLGWSQSFDLSAARAELGWAPRYSLTQSLDWAIPCAQ